jgi:hypothetical protein
MIAVHRYGHITRQKVDVILRALQDDGGTISGENPWEVDTHQSGVKLRGRFNEAASVLEVTIVDRDWYVPYSMVWRKIDALMCYIQRLPDGEIAAMQRDMTKEKTGE